MNRKYCHTLRTLNIAGALYSLFILASLIASFLICGEVIAQSAEPEDVAGKDFFQSNVSSDLYDDKESEDAMLSHDYIMITARGTGSRVSQIPGGVGLLEEEAIEEINPVSIADAARRMSGVEKTSDSAWGSDINIRGLGRNRIIFQMDGCRINTATDVNAQFGFMSPSDIERIEILKGPVSSLYGSGSMGGVVSVISKKGYFTSQKEWHGESSLTYSSNQEGLDNYENISFNSLDLWLFASGSYRDHVSYEAGDGSLISNSQFRDSHFRTAAGIKLNRMNVMELDGRYFEACNVGIPGEGLSLPSGADVTYPETSLSLLSLTHTFTPEGISLVESKMKLFYQKIERSVLIDNFQQSSSVISNLSGADHETAGVSWRNLFDFDKHTLVAGVDVWNWKIDDSKRYKLFRNGAEGVDSSIGEVEEFSGGIFSEDDLKLGDSLDLNLGGRVDYITSESSDLYNWITPPAAATEILIRRSAGNYYEVSWNAHAGLTWNFSPGYSMTFISASGYRAPDLMDRFKYINLGGGVELFGNPELDPERSLMFEYGVHHNTPNIHISGSLYANYLRDMIAEKEESSAVRIMENIEKAKIYGAELDLEWFFMPSYSFYTSICCTDGEDRSTGESLQFIPPLNGITGVRFDRNSGAWCSAEIEWAADQSDVPEGSLESGAWETLNLRGGYRFIMSRMRHEITVGVDNFFDRSYRNYLSTSRDMELKEPGISFIASWRVKF